MNKKYNLIYLLLIVFIASACGVKRPKEVIPEDTMENLLYDYHIAKAMGEGLPYNENYKRVLYVNDVFDKYGTTQEEFDSSMVWYTRNTEVLSKIYDKVNKRFKDELNTVKKQIAIRDNKPVVSEPGDSIDVWYLERMYRLTGHPLNNRLTFNLPSDTSFYDRDTLSWEVNYRFLGSEPDTLRNAVMAMHIVYENDSIISKIKNINRSGPDVIRLQSDTLGKIKEIKGFIYYNTDNENVKPLWIDSISLMRYHSNDTIQVNVRNSTEPEETLVSKEPPVQSQPITPVETVRPVTEQPRRVERQRPNQLRQIDPL